MIVEAKIVLLLEGDSQIRQFCRGILASGGYTVLEADNGMEALLVAAEREGAIDLLLTGSSPPGIAGDELALAFTMLWPDIDVLYMVETKAESLRPGLGRPVVRKPIVPESLLNAVRQLLEAPVPA